MYLSILFWILTGSLQRHTERINTSPQTQTSILNLRITGHKNKPCGQHNPSNMSDGSNGQGTLSLSVPSASNTFPWALDNANSFSLLNTPRNLATGCSPALLHPCCSSLAQHHVCGAASEHIRPSTWPVFCLSAIGIPNCGRRRLVCLGVHLCVLRALGSIWLLAGWPHISHCCLSASATRFQKGLDGGTGNWTPDC